MSQCLSEKMSEKDLQIKKLLGRYWIAYRELGPVNGKEPTGGWRQNQGPCHAKGLSDFWISLLVLLPPVTLELVASTSSPGRVLDSPCVFASST